MGDFIRLMQGFIRQPLNRRFVLSQRHVHLLGRLFHLGDDLTQVFHDRIKEVGHRADFSHGDFGSNRQVPLRGPLHLVDQAHQLTLQGFLLLSAVFRQRLGLGEQARLL